ncbi:MAG: HIT domain-containing protein [Sedimentisphaerales bacterium]|nr:HIT domain-containing protein [Sedimentisphaerales bacterium]
MKQNNLWAPWRIPYIRAIEKTSDCFLCHNYAHPEKDQENLVLWRTDRSLVVLNRFPYNNGHLLVAPARHIAELGQTSEDEMLELIKLVRESQRALSLAIGPHGFNVGLNFGRCAGAGLPGHMHVHVVPRWDGDTNFMAVCSDTKVISQSLDDLLAELKKVSAEQNLPSV